MQGTITRLHGWSGRQDTKPHSRSPSRGRHERAADVSTTLIAATTSSDHVAHPIHNHSEPNPIAVRSRQPSPHFATLTVHDALVSTAPTSLSFTCCIRPRSFTTRCALGHYNASISTTKRLLPCSRITSDLRNSPPTPPSAF
jgi:hypothetical protein